MIGKSLKLVSSLLLALVFHCVSARADQFHYTNLLIGERASGMGGAYTAVSNDATGLYYNPAGIAHTTGQSITASVNAYYNSEKKYNNVIGGNGWVRTSSSLLPNYFGVVEPVGRFKVGISYAVPEAITENQDQTFHNLDLSPSIAPFNPPNTKISSYIINFNDENSTYNFGPSIAADMNDTMSAGLTLYYYQRKIQRIQYQLIKTNIGGYEETSDKFKTDEWGIRPVFGFMWTPVNTVSVGLAVSKINILGSDTTYQHSYLSENFPVDLIPSDSKVVNLPDGQSSSDTKRKYPTQVSLGVAWLASPGLLISGDINHFTAEHAQGAEVVNNLALGAEYYFSKTWAMRTGFFTDYANTPKVSSNDIKQNEHIDLYGATLSFSRFTRNTSMTLGTGYTAGQGKAQILSGVNSIQDAQSRGWMLFLSSSYSY